MVPCQISVKLQALSILSSFHGRISTGKRKKHFPLDEFLNGPIPTLWYVMLCVMFKFLWVTRGACNPNLQVVVMHVLHVCSQHSFGLPLRMYIMYGMHITQFDPARLNLLSLLI